MTTFVAVGETDLLMAVGVTVGETDPFVVGETTMVLLMAVGWDWAAVQSV